MEELETLRRRLNERIEEGNALEALLPLSEKIDEELIKCMYKYILTRNEETIELEV